MTSARRHGVSVFPRGGPSSTVPSCALSLSRTLNKYLSQRLTQVPLVEPPECRLRGWGSHENRVFASLKSSTGFPKHAPLSDCLRRALVSPDDAHKTPSRSRACTRPQPLLKRQRVWGRLLRMPGLYWAARLTKLEKQETGNASRCNAYLTRLFQNTKPTALLLDQHFFLEQDKGTNIQYRNQMEILILQRLSSFWKSNLSVTKTRNKDDGPWNFVP